MGDKKNPFEQIRQAVMAHEANTIFDLHQLLTEIKSAFGKYQDDHSIDAHYSDETIIDVMSAAPKTYKLLFSEMAIHDPRMPGIIRELVTNREDIFYSTPDH